MLRRPPRSTRTDTLCPYTTLFRSVALAPAKRFRGIMRIIYMGTPDFAVPTLEMLVKAGHEVIAVYSQPPRPAGRGKALRPTPVHARAEAMGLEVRTPVSLKDADVQAAFAALNADVAVVAAYGLILPKAILAAPGQGCLNVHASLLPRWRGAAPIQRAIWAGDNVTGVTIMDMEAGLDTGRSEEHTSELQSLMRTSYAACCLKKKKTKPQQPQHNVVSITMTTKNTV